MGLIGNFFGLLLSGGYTAKTLMSDKANNREYDARRDAAHQSMCDYSAMLKSYEIENIVKKFVYNPANTMILKDMLSDELKYISQGDNTIIDYMFGDKCRQFTNQQKVDLLMSKFGKLSSATISGASHYGNLAKVSGNVDSYAISIRVMQCVESNIKQATSKTVLFGVNPTDPLTNGKYGYAHIIIMGTIINKVIRIYDFVDVPYTPIKLGDLKNV